MLSVTTIVGLLAALCTTLAYIPQVKKCWRTGRAADLSLKTFSLLAAGVALWVLYGVLEKDAVIVLANGISLALLACILYFKLRSMQTAAE